MQPEATSFLILCGGDGERMSGADKPLLEFRGRPMVDEVLESVPAAYPRIISANRNLDEYARHGTVVTDRESDRPAARGPLAGVYAGLCRCSTPWMLVSPGDTPLLPRNWAQIMHRASGGTHHVVAFDGERQQHLHLLLHCATAAPSLAAYLTHGGYQVHRWLDELQPLHADFEDPRAFRNINHPQDLSA